MNKKALLLPIILLSLTACGTNKGDQSSFTTSSEQTCNHRFSEASINWVWTPNSVSYSVVAKTNCLECHEEFTYDAVVELTSSTSSCLEDGEKVYTATAIFGEEEYHDTKVDQVSPLGHNPTGDWQKDETGHYHVCSRCNERFDVAEHTFGEWRVTKEPEMGVEGKKERSCDICSYTEEETIEALSTTVEEVQAAVNKVINGVFPYSYQFVERAMNLYRYLKESDKSLITNYDEMLSIKETYEATYEVISSASERTVRKEDDSTLNYSGTWEGDISLGNDNGYGEVNVLDIKTVGTGWGDQHLNGVSFEQEDVDESIYKQVKFAIYNPAMTSTQIFLFTQGWYFIPKYETHTLNPGWNEFTFNVKNAGNNTDTESGIYYVDFDISTFSIIIVNNQVNDGWMISDFYGVKSSTNDVDKVIELIDELPEVSNIDPIKTFATLDAIGLIYDDLSESALSQVTNKTKYEQVKAAYDSQYRVLLNPRLYQDMAVEGGANATYTKSFITDKTYGPVLKIDASVNSGTSQLYSYNLPNVTFAATDVLNFAIYSSFEAAPSTSQTFWVGNYGTANKIALEAKSWTTLSGTGTSFNSDGQYATGLNAEHTSFINLQRYADGDALPEAYSGYYYITAIVAKIN